MRKIFTFILALVASAGTLFASIEIDGIAYILNETDLTAEVTYKYEYNGDIVIPSSINYNTQTYSVTKIGNNAFEGCTGLTSIEIPNSVTSIGVAAFNVCSSLASVTIPNSVTIIGMGAFLDCSSLAFVNIGNGVTSIGDAAFASCSSLSSVTIPNSVTSIGAEAFSNCAGLSSVTISNSVTSIGNFAFNRCSALTSVTIPEGVASIGERAFSRCTGLTAINVQEDNPNYSSVGGVLFDKEQTELIQCPAGKVGEYAIPNSVTGIGYSAFESCSSLSSVTIPNSVTSIGSGAFSGCTALTSVTIPEGVTYVGYAAFYNCAGLTSVTCYAITPPELGEWFKWGYYEAFYGIDCSQIPLYVPAESISAYQAANEWKDFSPILPIAPQGIEDLHVDSAKAVKVLHDGLVYILRGEHVYDTEGKMVR